MKPSSVTDAIPVHTLREWACSPHAAEPALPLERPYLLVRLDPGPGGPTAGEQDAVARWLRRQPCPVIGIVGEAADGRLREACDVVAGDPAAASPLLERITHAPLASMVLVQVLRATHGLAIADALVIESLAYATLQGGPEFRRWLKTYGPRAPGRTRDEGPPVQMERDGEHLEIRLNRPARRNVLSVEVRDALVEALELVVADPSVRTARLSGNGDCFSAGGDLDEFGTAPDPATAHGIRSVRLPAAVLARCADRVEFHLHGACIGAGAELPAFGRRVTASRNTFFQLPEIGFGLIPGAGGCVSLPRRIGRQNTAYLTLSGRRLGAAEALEWGLVDAIVD